MGEEIRYTVNRTNYQVQAIIEPAYRGIGRHSAPDGSQDGPCRRPHFQRDPAAHPVRAPVDIQGRYESPERWAEHRYPATVQINQAGQYIWGWIQFEVVGNQHPTPEPQLKGTFQGKIEQADRCEVHLIFPTRPRSDIGSIWIRGGSPFELSFIFGSHRGGVSNLVISHGGYLVNLETINLTRVLRRPRIPDAPLNSIVTSNPLLYQQERHPLRSGQIEGMRSYLLERIGPRLVDYKKNGYGDLQRFTGLFNLLLMPFGAEGQKFPSDALFCITIPEIGSIRSGLERSPPQVRQGLRDAFANRGITLGASPNVTYLGNTRHEQREIDVWRFIDDSGSYILRYKRYDSRARFGEEARIAVYKSRTRRTPSGCNCACHERNLYGLPDPAGPSSSVSQVVRLRRCQCPCSARFSSQLRRGSHDHEQEDLAKAAFLQLLQTLAIYERSSGGPPTRITFLEIAYEIGIAYRNRFAGSGQTPQLFDQFLRSLAPRLHGRRQPLPSSLGRYHYLVEIEYTGASGFIPNTGVNLRGRVCTVRITRSEWDDSNQEWSDPHQMDFDGVMGGVGVDPLTAMERRDAEEPGSLDAEIGLESFEFEANRRWIQEDFPGYWEVFVFYAEERSEVTLGTGVASVRFSGSPAHPPLIAEMENYHWSSATTQSDVEAGAGGRWLPGYLFGQGGQLTDVRRAPDIIGSEQRVIQWGTQLSVTFATDQYNLNQQAWDDLGPVLAQYLVLFNSRNTELDVVGHASRKFRWFHNMMLSIRRAQAVLQAMVDSLGNRLRVPLRPDPPQNGDGRTRLYGFGEERATHARPPKPPGDDSEEDRRVDVIANGEVVLRLRCPSSPSQVSCQRQSGANP